MAIALLQLPALLLLLWMQRQHWERQESRPILFCNVSGDFSSVGSFSVSDETGTVTWTWGSDNGTWNSWGTGTSVPGTCCFPKKVSTSDGNADRIRYNVTNGVCVATGYSSTILVNNYYNEAPSSLAASSSTVCSGTAVVLTATFPHLLVFLVM